MVKAFSQVIVGDVVMEAATKTSKSSTFSKVYVSHYFLKTSIVQVNEIQLHVSTSLLRMITRLFLLKVQEKIKVELLFTRP